MKVCSKCHEPKPLSEFYIRKTAVGFGKPKPECKVCNVAAAVIWNRTTRMMRVYGITNEEFVKMELDQGGVCKICKKADQSRELQVDHDHRTGVVRGLLCVSCNTSLGKFEAHLSEIADYLGMHVVSNVDMALEQAEMIEK